MKKIGIVTTWFERGAAYVSKQFKETLEKEYEVFIYARGGEDIAMNNPDWDHRNITFGKRYSYTKLDLINLSHFKKWIKNNNLDVVFFNEQHIWDPVLLCNNMGVLTGAYIDYYTNDTVRFFGLYDFLVCNTLRHYSVFNWHPQAFYFPWGTDLNVFNETQMKTGNRDKIVFFHSAGMNPYRKGTDLLIKSFSKLNHSKSKLVIHTQINLNKFFPEIKKIITELSKNGRLEIINKTVTSPGLYHRGDIYVYPTRLEGIGLSIAEANACGMPVITTNNPPMSEFIINGVNGHLIDVYSKNKRKDGYYWKESHIDEVHLESILQEYCENIGEIKQRKKSALLYAKEHLSWQKNSYGLIKAVKGATVLEDKEEVIKQIRAYKKSNGFKLYITNIIVYQKLKKSIKNLLK